MHYETLTVEQVDAVQYATILSPPLNLLGPSLVRDLVLFILAAEADKTTRVIVFKSADPEYFVSHVDVTQIKAYREEAAKLTGEASIAMLFRYLSESHLVSIAQLEGRVRGAGSEFILGCDMRFAAQETAIFSQMEAVFGVVPGGGASQHLARLMGRGRALEVMLSADDYNADIAERYGWINRAMPAASLDAFVRALAQRISRFPASGHIGIKRRVNAITLASQEDFRRDSDLFSDGVRAPGTQARIKAAIGLGFQSREAEGELGAVLGQLPVDPPA